MELLEFFQALLPASGSYALFNVPRRKHIWAPTLDKLVACAQRVASEASWYYATASFDANSRTQEHVSAKRCLYLDIDAGAAKFEKDPDGTYATNSAAQSALLNFCRELRMPPSVVVHSGAGLHAYWAFSEDVDSLTWLPLAKALGASAKAHGLRVDSSCTTDSARILRPVGALHKNGNRVRVLASTPRRYTPEKMRALLAVEEEQFALTSTPSRVKIDVNATLVEFEYAPRSGLKVAEQCPVMHHVADVRGDVTEPLWRGMIGIAKHCVEGLDLAHEWSRGHPEYSPEMTEDKFNRYEKPPTTCGYFGKHSKLCGECKHKDKIKSPISLGALTVEQVKELPQDQQPEPARVNMAPPESPFEGVTFGTECRPEKVDGKWRLMGRKALDRKNDEGAKDYVWVRIADDVFWAKGWTEAGEAEADSAMIDIFIHHNSLGLTRNYSLPASVVATSGDLFKWLYGRGIARTFIDQAINNLMHNYVNHQFNVARMLQPRLAIRRRFGLQYDHEGHDAKMVCAQGRYVIRQNGTIEEAVIGKSISEHGHALTIRSLPSSATGVWSPSVWPKHIVPAARIQAEFFKKYYLKPGYEVAQLAVMLALSSPFMVFAADTHLTPGAMLPNIGLTISLYSTTSGQGKTSMQRAVASCYGDPATLVISGSNKDATPAFQSAFLAVLGTMPCFFDEVTQNNPQEVAQLIDRVAGGSDRHRSNRSGDARSSKTWALMTTVSTNVPQREMLATYQQASDALQMRLIELTCEFPIVTKDAHIDFEADRDDMLAPNYGSLGAVLNFVIVHTGPVKMRKLVQDRMRDAAMLIEGSSQRERFMQRGMACVLACHESLENAGLALFDKQTLIDQYIRATTDAVEYSTNLRRTPEDNIRRMVSDFSPGIIVTHSDWIRGATGDSRVDSVINRQQLRAPYVGRRVETTRILYMMSEPMRQWCADHQLSFSDMMSHAKKAGLLRAIDAVDGPLSKRIMITRGTDLSTVSGMCYAIDEGRLFYSESADRLSANVVPLARRESPTQAPPSQGHRRPAS